MATQAEVQRHDRKITNLRTRLARALDAKDYAIAHPDYESEFVAPFAHHEVIRQLRCGNGFVVVYACGPDGDGVAYHRTTLHRGCQQVTVSFDGCLTVRLGKYIVQDVPCRHADSDRQAIGVRVQDIRRLISDLNAF